MCAACKIMNIGLIDVDGQKFPNLALMKISAWHKAQGDHVEWCLPIMPYDIVYQSKVLDDTCSPDIDWVPLANKIVLDGIGYKSSSTLPDEIEHSYPDYSLYPAFTKNTAFGYLTRMSQRNNSKSIKVADLAEFWNGQRNIKLLDPDFLSCPDCKVLLQQLADSNAYVEFTQGLDIRRIDDEIVELLKAIRIRKIYLVWNNLKEELSDKLKWFAEVYSQKEAVKKGVYLLISPSDSVEEALCRIRALRELGYDARVTIADVPHASKGIRELQRWVNNKRLYNAFPTFDEYVAGRI